MDDAKDLISIITPLYNEREYIESTALSVIRQTSKEWEWIIVDDDSTDGSYEIVLNFANTCENIFLYKRPANKLKGASSCRNYGIEKSNGNYVMFLDADDLLIHTCIENRYKKRRCREGDVLVFRMSYMYDGEMRGIVNNDIWNEDPIRGFLRYELPWPITVLLWKKGVLEKIFFDETLQRLQDPDIHLLLLLTTNFTVNILEKTDVDCIYRIFKNKRRTDQGFMVKIAESFIAFFNKWSEHVEQLEEVYQKDYQLFILEILRRINRIQNYNKRKQMRDSFLSSLSSHSFFKQWEINVIRSISSIDNRVFSNNVSRNLLAIASSYLRKRYG